MKYPFKETNPAIIQSEMVAYVDKFYTLPETREFLKLCGNLRYFINLDAISYFYFERTNQFLKNLKNTTADDNFVRNVVNLCAQYLEESQKEFFNSKENDALYKLGIDTANFEKNNFSNFISQFLTHFFPIPEEEIDWWLYDKETHSEREEEPRYYYSIDSVEGNDVDVTKAIDFINFYLDD